MKCKQRGSRTEDASNKTKMPRLLLKKKGGGAVNGMDCSHADANKTMETVGEKSDFCRHRLSNLELMTYQ